MLIRRTQRKLYEKFAVEIIFRANTKVCDLITSRIFALPYLDIQQTPQETMCRNVILISALRIFPQKFFVAKLHEMQFKSDFDLNWVNSKAACVAIELMCCWGGREFRNICSMENSHIWWRYKKFWGGMFKKVERISGKSLTYLVTKMQIFVVCFITQLMNVPINSITGLKIHRNQYRYLIHVNSVYRVNFGKTMEWNLYWLVGVWGRAQWNKFKRVLNLMLWNSRRE